MENVGVLEDQWNDFDRLTDATKLLHKTKRRKQQWKTGLTVDFVPADKLRKYPELAKLNEFRDRDYREYGLLGRYRSHQDPRQEQFFFGLLRECLEKAIIGEELVRNEMQQNHLRHDALQVVESTPSKAA